MNKVDIKKNQNYELLFKAAKKWWKSHRPVSFSQNEHLKNPKINIHRESHDELAMIVAELIESRHEEK